MYVVHIYDIYILYIYIYIFIHIPGITDNIIKIPVTFLKISF